MINFHILIIISKTKYLQWGKELPMITGMSSSCYYPSETEKSLIKCGESGFTNVEIFVNTYSELVEPMCKEFKSIKEHYGLNIRSIHPFTSFAESTVIFGTYPRRVDDGMEFYKKYLLNRPFLLDLIFDKSLLSFFGRKNISAFIIFFVNISFCHF